jgi:hypothetical protein
MIRPGIAGADFFVPARAVFVRQILPGRQIQAGAGIQSVSLTY